MDVSGQRAPSKVKDFLTLNFYLRVKLSKPVTLENKTRRIVRFGTQSTSYRVLTCYYTIEGSTPISILP